MRGYIIFITLKLCHIHLLRSLGLLCISARIKQYNSMKSKTKIPTLKFLVSILISFEFLACADSKMGQVNVANPALADRSSPPTKASESIETQTSPPQSGSEFNLSEEVKYFDLRYELNSLNEKLTDNKGIGSVELYGTRNFRVVLPGVLYRGGANNTYMNPPRANINPLPTVGLKNLCEENFSTAVYLYSENFSAAPKSITCQNAVHHPNILKYKQYAAAGENEKILELVYQRIKGKLNGPIYTHCWNGWHSSGLISGMALKKFCGWSDSRVDAYWVKNTDGHYAGFESIRSKLRKFKPYARFAITAAERALICPTN